MTTGTRHRPDAARTAELLRAITAELADAYWERCRPGAGYRDAGRAAQPAARPARDRQERAGPGPGRPDRRRPVLGDPAVQVHRPQAFIDEIFKCSAGAPNETLAFLNERLYHPENGGAPIPCPPMAAITASNELPSGEGTAAVYDRLLVRLEVGYLADPSSSAALVRSAVTPPDRPERTVVPLDSLLHAVRAEVRARGRSPGRDRGRGLPAAGRPAPRRADRLRTTWPY